MSTDSTYDAMRARVPKGKRPTFFDDPATDQLWWLSLSLLGEITILRDRLDAHERLMARHGLPGPADVDHFEPDATEAADRTARREAMIERALRSITVEIEAARRASTGGQEAVSEEEP